MTQVEPRAEAGAEASGPGPLHAAPPITGRLGAGPDDERQFWGTGRMHFPEPITMLDDALMRTVYGHGFNRAAEQYGLPVRGHTRRIGAYHYSSMAPNVRPEQMEAPGKIAEGRFNPAVTGLADLWEREWLPEIQQHIARWRAFDLASASVPEGLMAHLDDTMERKGWLWEIHFLLAFPMLLGLSLFDDFYRDLFGDEDAFQASGLLQGFENKTLESNQQLWALEPEGRGRSDRAPVSSRRWRSARSSPRFRRAGRAGPSSPPGRSWRRTAVAATPGASDSPAGSRTRRRSFGT